MSHSRPQTVLTRAQRRGAEASRLVDAARRGEARAFDELVRRFRPRIYALALHLSGSHSDADDITQDAFLKAYRYIDRFEGRSEFFTWLYRIALNSALNIKRAQKRRPGLPLDDPRVAAALEVDAGANPRRQLELRETYAQLMWALDRLSPILKSTVVLTTLQGLNHREAAIILDTTEGVVAWRLHEARKRLRLALACERQLPAAAVTASMQSPRGLQLALELALPPRG